MIREACGGWDDGLAKIPHLSRRIWGCLRASGLALRAGLSCRSGALGGGGLLVRREETSHKGRCFRRLGRLWGSVDQIVINA
jgi:hypothetical protein